MTVPRLQITDPGLFSLKRATRAAIVLPAVLAFADKIVGDPQNSLSTLPAAPALGPRLGRCADALARDVEGLRSWYADLGHALADGTAVPAPSRPEDNGRGVARCARQALAAGDETVVGPALGLLWASQHLENLRELGGHLIVPAVELSG